MNCAPGSLGMDAFQLRQKHDALLLIGIGPGDDGHNGFGRAGVVGQVWDVGGDIEEVAGSNDGVVFETLSMPHAGFAGERVDGSLVRGVFVGMRASSGRDGNELHVEVLRADRFSGDADRVLQTLFAGEGLSGLKQAACR